jgi:phosphoglycerate kinase
MGEMIEDVEKVLLGGVPGELALIIEGYDLGEKEKWIKEKGFDSRSSELRELLQKYRDKIFLPEDLVMDSGSYDVDNLPDEMAWGIGEKTVEKFSSEIEEADSVLMKGPLTAYEEYPEGTKKVVQVIADSDAYTVLGGGHTSSLVQRFGFELEDFSHVSIAGGAFVRFMSGEDLPAVEALRD